MATMLGLMRKYEPLARYLRRQRAAELVLTFVEVERLLGAMLPKSASRPQWWANETNQQHTQCRAWLQSGYQAFLLSNAESVRFKRIARKGSEAHAAE